MLLVREGGGGGAAACESERGAPVRGPLRAPLYRPTAPGSSERDGSGRGGFLGPLARTPLPVLQCEAEAWSPAVFPGRGSPLRPVLAGRAADSRPGREMCHPRVRRAQPGAARLGPRGPHASLGRSAPPRLATRQPPAALPPVSPEERGDGTCQSGLGPAPGLPPVRDTAPQTPVLCHAVRGHMRLLPGRRRGSRLSLRHAPCLSGTPQQLSPL